MAETPKHYVRVPHDIWHKAASKAQREGTTPSKLVRDFLEGYADDGPIEDEMRRIITRLIGVHKRMKG